MKAVREGCAIVAARALHVRIDASRIKSYAEMLLDKYSLITGLDENHFHSADAEKNAAYILALASINFGSGWMGEESGFEYTVLASGLRDAFSKGEMDAPEKWAAADAACLARIFSAGSINDLLELFATHLREAGCKVLAEYDGRVLNLLDAAQGSAERLAMIVSAWPGFHDVALYDGIAVPILKRAQILAADMQLAGVAQFQDMDALTIFADNMVPHVLRHDGVLHYDPALAARIDSGDMLDAGNAEETELRACAVHVVEMMVAAVNRHVTAVNFDHLLWNRGYEPEFYARPRHRTKTVWY
jgi:Potential Queuosine, Q, salvage protein family